MQVSPTPFLVTWHSFASLADIIHVQHILTKIICNECLRWQMKLCQCLQLSQTSWREMVGLKSRECSRDNCSLEQLSHIWGIDIPQTEVYSKDSVHSRCTYRGVLCSSAQLHTWSQLGHIHFRLGCFWTSDLILNLSRETIDTLLLARNHQVDPQLSGWWRLFSTFLPVTCNCILEQWKVLVAVVVEIHLGKACSDQKTTLQQQFLPAQWEIMS